MLTLLLCETRHWTEHRVTRRHGVAPRKINTRKALGRNIQSGEESKVDLHMTIAMRHIKQLFLILGFLGSLAPLGWAQPANQGISYREFLQ